MSNLAYIDGYLNGVSRVVDTISRSDIDRAIDTLYEAWESGGTIFTIGNGGSASTASHFVSDLNKMTIVEGHKRVRALSLVDNIPWVSALVNDEGWEKVYEEQLRNLFEPGDVVIAISVHGGSGADNAGLWSQNLLRALQYAKDNGGTTIGLSGFDGGAMKSMADVCVVVPIDSTPLVESFHVTLHHLIVSCLAERIRATALP